MERSIRLLEEYLDKTIIILLRDNSVVEGVLRSFDQYYNILLENVKENENVTILLRGENIIFLGNLKKIEKNIKISDDLDFITL